MTCKVIGAKLIFGVVAVLYEVICPRLQKLFVLFCQGAVAVSTCCGGDSKNGIATLLNGHLVFERVAAVNLTVAKRILSAVVRCKRILPSLALGIIKDGAHHTAHEFGIVNKIQRNRRIRNVERCHASVGEVLLGEEHHFAVDFAEFVCRNGLTVSQSAEL